MYGSPQLMRLGALADADFGLASGVLGRLADRRISLAHQLIAAQQQGTALPAHLADNIDALETEVDALSNRMTSIDHAELQHWLAQAQALDGHMTDLQGQLNLAIGADTSRTIRIVVGGGAAAVLVLGGIAYYVRKHMRGGR